MKIIRLIFYITFAAGIGFYSGWIHGRAYKIFQSPPLAILNCQDAGFEDGFKAGTICGSMIEIAHPKSDVLILYEEAKTLWLEHRQYLKSKEALPSGFETL